MSMVSKSMFSNAIVTNYQRPIYNPVYTSPQGSTDLNSIAGEYFYDLKIIEQNYSSHMAEKEYEKIPNDYNAYVKLYVMMNQLLSKIRDPKILVLVKIAQEALVGAINSYALYGSNISLTFDKIGLNKTINDILSNKNEKVIDLAVSTGQLMVKKNFKLAPVFNYYIMIYGMPAYGVGFDPVKINFLVGLLEQAGINPYK